MRIVAGTYRSRVIQAVEGNSTRPTQAKIKEAIFSRIGPYFDGGVMLDLFAGSGQIGLEAVSRGAACAVFVEQEKKACACIEENIRFTKSGGETKLFRSDVVGAIRAMSGAYRFDVVFLDPPYGQGLEQEALRALAASTLLADEALLILETSLNADLSWAEETGYEVCRVKKYKTNEHVFMRKK